MEREVCVKCKYMVGVLIRKLHHPKRFGGISYHYITMHDWILVPFATFVIVQKQCIDSCAQSSVTLVNPCVCETGMVVNPAVEVGLDAAPRHIRGCACRAVWHLGVRLRCPRACPQQKFWVRTWAPAPYNVLAWGKQGRAVSGVPSHVLQYRHSLSPTGIGGKGCF